MIVSIIAAMAELNRGIGYQGGLPWRLPAEVAHFKAITMGHCIIMGRKTFESIPGSLPGRKVIVLTRGGHELKWAEGFEIAGSIEDAIRLAREEHRETEVFIAGGEEVYAEALSKDLVDRMYLTEVHAVVEADRFFPLFDGSEWVIMQEEYFPADEDNPHSFTCRMMEKKQ
ncbi:MAG: dihydrofolate reductase [Anaerolineales bacterium]|nr:dihydrofolate reductase [Anaerolineales bacterium]